MTLSQDILAELAEIAPDSALAAARAGREAAPQKIRGGGGAGAAPPPCSGKL